MAEQVAGSDQIPLWSRLGEASNILVMAPSFTGGTSGVCKELLAGGEPSAATVLGITYTVSPGEFIEDWQEHTATEPAHGQIISVGEQTDDRTGVTARASGTDAWSISGIESPGDLTGLGITLSEFLSEKEDASVRLCFDSLTALLQYADLKQAFRFLHIVTGRVKSANGVGHYHLDPAAHDQQTLATIQGLFDAVVEVDDAGEWTIKTR